MSGSWLFFQHDARNRARNPLAGEFFADDAIEGAAEALVREGIQNSVDARRKGPNDTRTPAKVRIFVSESASADTEHLGAFFKDLWPHINAQGNGLKHPPTPEEPCHYLVFEDFGTTGLEGDIGSSFLADGLERKQNPFFCFVRAEGITDKGDGRGGSWGVGKYVFPRSSRANAILFCTKRDSDGQTLVMGSCTLKMRKVNGRSYSPDGWFGTDGRNSDGEQMVMPVNSESLAAKLGRTFGLKRAEEPGLSIIVPWYDPEITYQALITAVVRGWFLPIISGDLSVQVDTPHPAQRRAITAETIIDSVNHCAPSQQAELRALVQLAHAYGTGTEEPPRTRVLGESGAPRFTDDMIAPDVAQALRTRLNDGKPCVVRVPFVVRRKKIDPAVGTVDVCIMRDATAQRGKVTYVRENLLIPQPKPEGVPGYRALVVAPAGPMAALLRAAEHPAHTHWSKDTSNFKDEYTNGPSYISCIKQIAARVIELILDDGQNEDKTLLQDVFSLPAPPEQDDAATATRRRKRRKDAKEVESTPVPDIENAPRPFTLSEVAGGFVVRSAPDTGSRRLKLTVRAAYARREGNPFSKWHKADFQMLKGAIKLGEGAFGLDTVKAEDNRLQVTVQCPFEFAVRGFDTRRDLKIKVEGEVVDE